MTPRSPIAWFLLLAALAVVGCATLSGMAGAGVAGAGTCTVPVGASGHPGDTASHGGGHDRCEAVLQASGPSAGSALEATSRAMPVLWRASRMLTPPTVAAIPNRPLARFQPFPHSLFHQSVLFLN